MSGRIKELAEQAGKIHAESFRWQYMNEIDKDIFEKFAELIVRECTNMLPEDSIRNADGVHMFYVIRKHFGVEE